MRKLSDEQVEAFDREYVDTARFIRVCQRVDADFPDGRFTFLDIGGGNGRFSDQLLERYPAAHATVLDNSEVLLERNEAHARKSLLLGSAAELNTISERFDLVSLHWLLHHLVGDTYSETRANQLATLRNVNWLLTERGRVSIYENDYIGYIPGPIPTFLIYLVTASKTLVPIARRMGANTAGVGVCFNSFRGWRRMIGMSGLTVLDHVEPDSWKRRLSWHSKYFLGLQDVRVGHYWVGRNR